MFDSDGMRAGGGGRRGRGGRHGRGLARGRLQDFLIPVGAAPVSLGPAARAQGSGAAGRARIRQSLCPKQVRIHTHTKMHIHTRVLA